MPRAFLKDNRLRVPILVGWASAFGGSLQSPAISYYYLELGLDAVDIGDVGLVVTFGSLLLGPLYGWLLDKWDAYLTIALTLGPCGIGCLLRGIAHSMAMIYASALAMAFGGINFDAMVLAYVAHTQSVESRALVISAYLFQYKTLSLVGKSLYPVWDRCMRGLGVEDDMLRYRLVMVTCTAPCLLGFGAVMAQWVGSGCKAPSTDPMDTGKYTPLGTEDPDRPAHPRPPSPATPPSGASGLAPPVVSVRAFCCVAAILVSQSMANTMINVLWPLYIKQHFAWRDVEYSYLLFVSSLLAALSIALQPSITSAVGLYRSPIIALAASALCFSITFTLQDASPAAMSGHVVGAVVCVVTTAFLKPSLAAIASLYMPVTQQGRSFGVMASLEGIGGILTNLVATRLYQQSLTRNSLGAGGALPFYLLTVLLLLGALLLLYVSQLWPGGARSPVHDHVDLEMVPVPALGLGVCSGEEAGPDGHKGLKPLMKAPLRWSSQADDGIVAAVADTGVVPDHVQKGP